MKRTIYIVAVFLVLISLAGLRHRTFAGTAEKIEDGTQKAVSEIKKDTVETGKAIAETGKQVKAGTRKGWSDFKKDAASAGAAVKESVTEVGKEIKKAFHETKAAVTKKLTENNQNKPEEKK